jgi:hypothetical protein
LTRARAGRFAPALEADVQPPARWPRHRVASSQPRGRAGRAATAPGQHTLGADGAAHGAPRPGPAPQSIPPAPVIAMAPRRGHKHAAGGPEASPLGASNKSGTASPAHDGAAARPAPAPARRPERGRERPRCAHL